MVLNPAALEVGQLAERMAQGYYTHAALVEIARDPRAKSLAPTILPGHVVPEGYVECKDGENVVFHFNHFLDQAKTAMAEDLARTWLVGALLTVGDALAKNKYFDHAPELELLRHLRNGIAHGNSFNIKREAIDPRTGGLKHPAHNRLARVKSDLLTFEISPALHGQPVLFDFMKPGDVIHLLVSAGLYLVHMGNGDSLR